MMSVPAPQRQSALRALVSRQEGSTSVEYAVLFGVVVLSLVVGVFCLGQMSRNSLGATAVSIRSAGSTDTSSNWQGNSSATVANSDGLPASVTAAPGIAQWQIVATGIALFVACGAPLSYVVLKPRFRKPAESAETDTASHAASVPSHDEQAFAKRNQIRNVFENNMASLLEGRLKVRHVMSRQLTCVRKSASVDTVREMMDSKQIPYVIVSTAEGQLLGIISHQDCADRTGKRAADIMTAKPFSLDADSDLSPAVTMLIRRRISCLPVTSDGILAGVVTTTDFLMALQCALHTLSNVVEHLPGSRMERLPKAKSPTPDPL